MRILLVEDDEGVAEALTKSLTEQHYVVELATDGQAGWELAEAFTYDLILLDVMLPRLDGISICRQLRALNNHTPILLLTAEETSTNKVMGLDAGADDYVIKPFDLHELLARIRALLRRGNSSSSPVIEWDSLRLDPSSCEVTYNEQPLRLTAKEYALLELFLRNTHRIFSQSALLDQLWSFEELPSENAVRAHIKSLRHKLKKAGAADVIETVYGLGYRLKPKESVNTQMSSSETNLQAENPSFAEQSQQQVSCQNSKLSPTSLSVTSAEQTQLQITPRLSTIWEQCKGKYGERITVLEQALAALQTNSLDAALRQQAYREAHTLKGSLGIFGFSEASRLSKQIEQLFKTQAKFSQTQLNSLSQLLVSLRQELEQPPTFWEPQTPKPVRIKQPRLLIVDDDIALGLALVSQAPKWGLQAQAATTLAQAREMIRRSQPNIVLLDLCFPDSAEDGFELLAELTTKEPPISVVVFTAKESFSDRVTVARLGGRGFLHKPISPAEVMQAVNQFLQHSQIPEAKLLIVDDDVQLLDFLRTLLDPWGFKLALLDAPTQFWETLEQFNPDLLILDLEMPELSGIDLCQVVRNDPHWGELPVLFLSAHTDAQTVHQVFLAGADDYVNKPIVGPELVARILNRLERIKIRRKRME